MEPELLKALIGMVSGLFGLMLWMVKIIHSMNRKIVSVEASVNAAGDRRKQEIRVFVNEMLNKSFERITDRLETHDKLDLQVMGEIAKLRLEIEDIRRKGKFYNTPE